MSRDPLADLVAMLATASPSMRPACAGTDAHLFDATNVDDAADALALCAGCRADVVEWCRYTVNPANTWFDGVCAGQVYRNGKTVEQTPDMLRGLLLADTA